MEQLRFCNIFIFFYKYYTPCIVCVQSHLRAHRVVPVVPAAPLPAEAPPTVARRQHRGADPGPRPLLQCLLGLHAPGTLPEIINATTGKLESGQPSLLCKQSMFARWHYLVRRLQPVPQEPDLDLAGDLSAADRPADAAGAPHAPPAPLELVLFMERPGPPAARALVVDHVAAPHELGVDQPWRQSTVTPCAALSRAVPPNPALSPSCTSHPQTYRATRHCTMFTSLRDWSGVDIRSGAI
ncbi:hypothetical protein HF086_000501 [Spodoptera exigua]|uniref:Uncharacterized protein n=1 Tax=Spodoptera exigua TaxID=7107 RepID=A0A922MT69_SPOEX|nr:hypothetical protein HF086_000501 [Spodoptera exigua]